MLERLHHLPALVRVEDDPYVAIETRGFEEPLLDFGELDRRPRRSMPGLYAIDDHAPESGRALLFCKGLEVGYRYRGQVVHKSDVNGNDVLNPGHGQQGAVVRYQAL